MIDDEIEKLAGKIQEGMGLDGKRLKAMFEKGGEPRLAGNVIPENKLAEVSAFFQIPRDRLNLLPGQLVYVLSLQLEWLRDPADPSKFKVSPEEMLQDFGVIRDALKIVEKKEKEEGDMSALSE